MKISYAWLREYLDVPPPEATAELLTQLGLEVDKLEPVGTDIANLQIGTILATEPHPNADRLKITHVSFGDDNGSDDKPLAIICGAPNARAGIKVVCAHIGAVLPGNFKIKRSKIRGVESAGMLCSARELGMGDEHDGILELPTDAPLGADAIAYLGLTDTIIHIDLTPNRGDCFSLKGIVRELAAMQGQPMPALTHDAARAYEPTANIPPHPIRIESTACHTFCTATITHVDNRAPTPRWMQRVLMASGIRSINLIVDITNYVMLLIGQPMHAYDATRIKGAITVRRAVNGEQLTLLNDTTVTLTGSHLAIADDEKLIGLAGIMGGQASQITERTNTVILEAAHFDHDDIRGKARGFDLATDAATRFERGVDPTLPPEAIQIATALILTYGGGQASAIGQTIAKNHNAPTLAPIILPAATLNAYLGDAINMLDASQALTAFGFDVNTQDDALHVRTPPHRFDIHGAEDLVEEVIRFHGYDTQITPHSFSLTEPKPNLHRAQHAMREYWATMGFSEAITYSFIGQAWHEAFFPSVPTIALTNPISTDMAVMRGSLIPGLVKCALDNAKRQRRHIALFEIGRIFTSTANAANTMRLADITEATHLAALVHGPWYPPHWRHGKDNEQDSFYRLKGMLEAFLTCMTAQAVAWQKADLPTYYHPEQSASLYTSDTLIGHIGTLHPALAGTQLISARAPITMLELNLDAIPRRTKTLYAPISPYPSVYRDVSFYLAHDVPVGAMVDALTSAKIPHLVGAHVFDIYQDDDGAMKSVSLHLQFQHAKKTLTDPMVDKSLDAIWAWLKTTYHTVPRT